MRYFPVFWKIPLVPPGRIGRVRSFGTGGDPPRHPRTEQAVGGKPVTRFIRFSIHTLSRPAATTLTLAKMKTQFQASIGAMALLFLLLEPAPARGGKEAPKQKVENQKQEPPVLGMDIHAAKGGMEVEFNNHTAGEVRVKVGKKLIRLKPGETAKMPIQKQEEMNIYEKVREAAGDMWQPRVTTLIFPRPAKAQFLGPR
ncbi:MAG: hypothetical protein J0M04_07035 [Verrucomicrobia bacterium]|nr:hypothetical protein [Verrucomicrobiota bacterium]